ncbi:MAG: peptidyl-prolyl cis-trans isomerase [Gemmatimonadota bacterium]|nr:peptidyl-prolyl cis-trans isomerase [Gemmatimonadota bacterium]
MNRRIIAFVGAFGLLAACEGFKEAMTAHVDIVARAATQELSVDRLSEMLGAMQVPLKPEIAKAVAELWVNYQLAAEAAARNDSLKDPKAIDAAMWPMFAQMRASKWHDIVSKTWKGPDTAGIENRYSQGEMLAARHILWVTQGLTQAKKDSMHKVAESVQKQATGANFTELANKYTMEPGANKRGGDLGVFPKGNMVPEFQKALQALKPGEVSPVTETQFGYHIIYRPKFAEVKDQFAERMMASGSNAAESTYMARVTQSGDIKFKSGAAATIKSVAKDLDVHHDDKTVIATSKAGDFTAGRLAQWIEIMPRRQQVVQALPTAPDSDAISFARNFLTNELVLHQADSAKVTLADSEKVEIRKRFTQVVSQVWQGLGVAPTALRDSAKSEKERERVAGGQVDRYMDKLLANQAQYVDIPAPVQTVLREKFDWKLNTAGLDRAVQRAAQIRNKADSVRASQRPQSQVPMPQMQIQPGGAHPSAPAPQPVKPPVGAPPATKP